MSDIPRNTTARDRHRKIIARDKPDCHVCGGPINYYARSHLDPLAFTIDHLIPLNRGGPDTLDNLAACHRHCNRTKGDKPIGWTSGVSFVTDRRW